MITAFDIDRGYRRTETDKLAAIDEQLDIVERDRDFYRDEFLHVRAAGAICEHAEELQRRLDAIRAIVESDEWRRVDMTNYDRQMQRIENVLNNNNGDNTP